MNQIDKINDAIVNLSKYDDYILDVKSISEIIGTQKWVDPSQWNSYKLQFSQALSTVYVDHIGRLLGSIRGKTRKCLVLDLDNTIWGGVIGDDGLSG